MSKTTQREFYSRLKREGRLHGTIARAMRLWEQRSGNVPPPKPNVRRHRRVIPVGDRHAERCRIAARDEYPQRHNWEHTVQPYTTRFAATCRVQSIDNGRYSSRCTYTHWTYRVYVTSYGYVLQGVLHWRIGTQSGVSRPPRGYRWDVDRHGIRIVATRDNRCDFHPDSDDILSLTPREMAAKARENLATRIAAAKQAREIERDIRRAERQGAYVRLRDSIAAGNCPAGTQRWCYDHQIDPRGYYKPSQVLALANGDTDRVRIVVVKALQRHRQEMRQGYCTL